MRKLILIPLLFTTLILSATNYYVKNGGSDAANGLTDFTAWETINKINTSTFSAGDTVFFKRGGIWRETLTVPSSGSVGHPIVFSAYGTGINPIITGANVITSWTTESVQISAVVPAVTGNLAVESFNGTGYVLGGAWYEDLGSGSVADEDNTDISDRSGSNSQILKIQKVSPNYTSAPRWRSGSAPAVSYAQVYINITAEGLSTTNYISVLTAKDASYAQMYRVRVLKTGTTLNWYFVYYNNGADRYYTSTSTVSLNTWYKLDVKWDLTGNTFEFKVDGVSQISGSLSGTLKGNPRDFMLGDDSNSKTLTAYYDDFGISSTGYITPEIAAVYITTYKKYLTVRPRFIFQDGSMLTENITSKASLTTGQYWWNSATDSVFVRTTGDDNVSGYTMEGAYRDRGISGNGKNYLGIENINFKGFNERAISVYGSTHVTINNCAISHSYERAVYFTGGNCLLSNSAISYAYRGVDFSGGNNIINGNTFTNIPFQSTMIDAYPFPVLCSGIDDGSSIYDNKICSLGAFGTLWSIHGIYLDGGQTNQNIHNNIIHGVPRGHGIKFIASSGSIYNNLIYDCNYAGISVNSNDATDITVTIFNNVSFNNHFGFVIYDKGAGDINVNLYNNTFYLNNSTVYDASPNEIAIQSANITSLDIKNNIIYATANRYAYSMDNAQANADIDYNIIYQASGSLIYYNSANRTFATWQGYGFDVNGLNEDPLLTSTLRLQSASRAINAATDVGLTVDLNSHIYQGLPDIGAYEYGTWLLTRNGLVVRDADGKWVTITQ